MRKTMKVRLAVFLSILMILPSIISVLPMASTEVLAADNSTSLYWNWSSEYKTIEVEEGQQFYLGDYACVNTYGSTYWYGNASLVKATYTSSNKSVATIDSKGYFSAKSTGTTTVTVKYKGKKIKTVIKVVPEGTFATSKNISGLKKKAEAISKQIPSKITTKNGFKLYKVVAEYETYIEGSNEISARGFLKEPITFATSSFTYYKETAKLAVPQAGRYCILRSMLNNYGLQNNPTGTRGAKLLKVKSVSATKSAITIKLKKKIDTTQILAARILGYNVGNEALTGNTKAYTYVYVYDKKTQQGFRCKAELKKGSKTIKLTPMKYSEKSGKWVKTKLTKGHTYVLETKYYWTKGKTVKVK